MRKRRASEAGHESSHGIDLAPMLDFVINLLIFFIITAVFVKESGLQVNRPTSFETPPDEQAAFRIDFPAWVRTHTHRHRRLIKDLMHGERTKAVARKYGVSAARISQLRRELMEDWRRFRGEAPTTAAATGGA